MIPMFSFGNPAKSTFIAGKIQLGSLPSPLDLFYTYVRYTGNNVLDSSALWNKIDQIFKNMHFFFWNWVWLLRLQHKEQEP